MMNNLCRIFALLFVLALAGVVSNQHIQAKPEQNVNTSTGSWQWDNDGSCFLCQPYLCSVALASDTDRLALEHISQDTTTTYTAYLPLVVNNYYHLPAPTLISPPNGSTVDSISPFFRWKPNVDPNMYFTHFQVSEDPNFSSYILSYGRKTIIGDVVEEDLMWNLKPSTTYYWRATNAYQSYSEIWSFTTGSGGILLPAPELISPASGSSFSESEALTFTWASVAGATDYFIWVGQSSRFWTCRTRDPQESYGPYSFLPGTNKWKVSARNDYGWSEFSSEWLFTITGQP